MLRFAGCCRFVWNKALELEKAAYVELGERLGYNALAKLLPEWKADPATGFLAEAPSQALQQVLMDLDRAYTNFFQKRASHPRFKKRGQHDSFRYPQGFKLEEGNSRIYLPKIGWVPYRNSRKIEGKPKQVTVSLSAGKWYVSIQTEREVDAPVHSSQKEVGIDMGVACFAALSDGTTIQPIHSFRKHEKKLAKLQRSLSRKKKFSANWRKQKAKIARLHKKIADLRNDFLHKHSATISKNHAVVVVEDLKIQAMTVSASGSVDAPGRNVEVKSRFNKAILDQGWGEFKRQLGYKLEWLGGVLLAVSPENTSITCSQCRVVDSASRRTRARFLCTNCGYDENADHNAALNILVAGQAMI